MTTESIFVEVPLLSGFGIDGGYNLAVADVDQTTRSSSMTTLLRAPFSGGSRDRWS
ncbi:hypothetical protein [Candidatus Amarobacter glycogenicus]|uniref:hypothetical protein n=1 Tax=Candidatus Amarobacter glycogenicus TaxID=3140699 RepID=UPI0031369756|nr:hypothetical protein [Dehalococcoidia bacterium]